jgi:hypothetical protein
MSPKCLPSPKWFPMNKSTKSTTSPKGFLFVIVKHDEKEVTFRLIDRHSSRFTFDDSQFLRIGGKVVEKKKCQ